MKLRYSILLCLLVSIGSANALGQGAKQKSDLWIPAGLTEKEIAEGWIALFDGKTKYGWRAESKVDWSVQEGSLSADTGEVGLLRTTSQFDNFVLRLEFQAAKGSNSGVFIRTPPRPTRPDGDCYEINIAPADNPFPTGSIVARRKGVVIEADDSRWHTMEIVARGAGITVSIDGTQTVEYQCDNPLGRGYIGLQYNSGSIKFRKIRLKPLQLKSIFNGKDLSGWTTYPKMKSTFTVENEALRVRNGSGQIETKGQYADFILQFRCRTNAPKLNSGVFFRCIPGKKMDGYESQIQNGFKQDRTQPDDCGTGGIFRRKNARYINSDDQQWFSKTIVTTGPHFAVWVNGLQVSDWTDKRKKNDNPRRGLRLKAGTIILQGHDPTTDLQFKEFFIREIDPRRPKRAQTDKQK